MSPKIRNQAKDVFLGTLISGCILLAAYGAITMDSHSEPKKEIPQRLVARHAYVCVNNLDELMSLQESAGSVFAARAERLIQNGDADLIKEGESVLLESNMSGVAMVDTANMRGCLVPASILE
jgi:hypothetical protein